VTAILERTDTRRLSSYLPCGTIRCTRLEGVDAAGAADWRRRLELASPMIQGQVRSLLVQLRERHAAFRSRLRRRAWWESRLARGESSLPFIPYFASRWALLVALYGDVSLGHGLDQRRQSLLGAGRAGCRAACLRPLTSPCPAETRCRFGR